MPPLQVSWRLVFRAHNFDAASKCLARVLKNVVAEVDEAPKPYTEQAGRWEVSIRSRFAAPTAEGVLGLLVDADQLATGWLVTGPVLSNGSVTTFDGVFSVGPGCRPYVAGLEWASFSVFDPSAVVRE
jgi:hypothetical protein